MGFVFEGLMAAQPLRRPARNFAVGQLEGECEEMTGSHSVFGVAFNCRKCFMHVYLCCRKFVEGSGRRVVN